MKVLSAAIQETLENDAYRDHARPLAETLNLDDAGGQLLRTLERAIH
tara:strand:- start:4786 stop:4926 length:141 start_codon:yes stop_codon:yes gene_type:complete